MNNNTSAGNNAENHNIAMNHASPVGGADVAPKNARDDYEIDLLRILGALWKRAWLVLLVSILAGVITMLGSMYLITPKYSSSVMLYVNNRSLSVGGTSVSISASELSAAQSLVDTYIVILNNRTTMNEVIERSGVDRSWGELLGMISSEPVGGTEVFRVAVTSEDPYEAATIANCIAEVLPERIGDIIEGSSMRIVDSAVVNTGKVAPNITKNTTVALVIAALITCLLLAVIEILDDTLRDEDSIMRAFDLPILAKIPLTSEGHTGHGYYRSYGSYDHYGYYKHHHHKHSKNKGAADQ